MSGRDAKVEAQAKPPEQKAEEPQRDEARGDRGASGLALMGRLTPPAGPAGGSGASDHAVALSRAGALRPGQAGPWMLQLQRQLGNRHVQRVVSLARAPETGEAGIDADVEQAIQGARGGGRALDGEVRGRMESAFGTDFGGVRVHTGAQADQLNRSLSARAFTTGSDIFFRAGEYSPGSSGGRELLAHELTHVVQQQGAVQTSRLTLGPPGDRYEQEAEETARAVMRLDGEEGETVQRAAFQPAAFRGVQRAGEDSPELAAAETFPLRIHAGTFEQAADTFSFQLKRQLNLKPGQPAPKICIIIVNGGNLRVFDLDGKPVGSSAFRLAGQTDLPVGVFAQKPASDRRLHAILLNPDGTWSLTPGTIVGKVDFGKDVEPQDELDALTSRFDYGYYVIPSAEAGLVPEDDLPKAPPPEERPEFLKFDATAQAGLPAWPAAVIPLTPQVTSTGSIGKFYCRLDKYNPWLGIVGNTFALLEPVNFHWEVLKLDPKLLVTGKETATRFKGAAAAFSVRERHIEDDETTLLGSDDRSKSLPEKAVRRIIQAQMAIPRRILAYTGEAALTVLHTLAGGTDKPSVEDFIDFKFDEPGDYFVRCLATPVPGEKSKQNRATSVAGAMVSVFDVKELAAESLTSPEEERRRAVAGVEKGDADLAELRKKRAATADANEQAVLDIQIRTTELRRVYLEATAKAAGDEHALRSAELDFVRAQLSWLTGKDAPHLKRRAEQEGLGKWIESLRKSEKEIAGELERADSKLGEGFKRTGEMTAVLVDDTTGARQPLTFSIGEKSYVAADKIEVVIADIGSEKGRVFNGTGSGSQGQGRSDAWHEAMSDLRRNLGRGRGWLAWRAPAPYSALSEGLDNPVHLQTAELDQLKEYVDDAAHALTLGALIAAPFTGGASLGLLAVLAPIQAGSSLYNIVNRALYSDLELDQEAVGNFVDVATLGLAKVSSAGRLASRGVRILATTSRVALQLLEKGMFVVITYSTYQELTKEVQGETEAEARVRKLRALLSLFEMAAIPVAAHLYPQAHAAGAGKKPGEPEAGGTKPRESEPVAGEETPLPGRPRPSARAQVPDAILAEIPKDVQKNAPPVINPNLVEGTVRIVYEVDGNRVITKMRLEIAPGTRPDLVAAHIPAARDMARYKGLSGRVRLVYEQVVGWLKRNPIAEPGSRAWEAEREVRKLQSLIEERAAQYDAAAPDSALREELHREIDHLESQLIEHARDIDLFDVEGRGFVAAEGRGEGGEPTFGPKTTRREAFSKLGGFETRPGASGTLEAANDFRHLLDATVHEGGLAAPEEIVNQLPDPKGVSRRTVLDQAKKLCLDKLVARATDAARLRGLDAYRDAHKGTTKPSEALYAAGTAEAQRIAALLPEGDRAAFLAAWKEKMPAPPAGATVPAVPTAAAAPGPVPATPAPPVADSTRAARKWIDDLRETLPEAAQRRLDAIERGKTPEEVRALVEKLGGRDFFAGGAKAAAEKAAAAAASPARAREAKDRLAADPDFLSHPDVQKAIETGDARKLRSEMATEMAARQLLEGPYKGQPGVRVHRGVRIIREQPYKTAADARTALDAKSRAETGEPYKGVIFERGGKVYTVSTDIDVLVIQEQPGKPAKILRFEEVKSGEKDKPGKAAAQVEKAAKRLDELGKGDTSIHLELADGTEITGAIDAASGAQAEQKTRGPLGDKEFGASLDVTPADLLEAAKELLAEQQRKKTPGGGGGSGASGTGSPAPASPAPAPAPASPTPAGPAGPAAKEASIADLFKPGELEALLTPPPGERIDRPQASIMEMHVLHSPDRFQELIASDPAFSAALREAAAAPADAAPVAPIAPIAPTAPLTAYEPTYKTLDELLTPDKGGFSDKDVQDDYARYVAERKKAGETAAGPEEWASLTRGAPRERLRTLLGPGHFFGIGTGVERLVPLADFQQPAAYTAERLEADVAAATREPGKLWERLKRLQADGVTGGAVGASLFNILKGNVGEILSGKIQETALAEVRKKNPDAALYTDVRARLVKPDGTLSDPVLFTDNVIASKRGGDLQLHSVFEVKAGSHGGQEATTQIFEWIEGHLQDGLEIQAGGEWFRYDPAAATGKRVVGLARAERHLIAVKGAEHLGQDSEFKTVREATRHALPQTAEEINYLTRVLIDRFISKQPATE